MRRRRTASVLAITLAAHAALLAVWMAPRADRPLAEAPAMEITLVRPPRLVRASRPARDVRPSIRVHVAPVVAPSAVSPLVPPAPLLIAPSAGPHALTDQELLAGPRPTIQQLRDAPVQGGQFTGGANLRPCKPDGDLSDDPRPPCPALKNPNLLFEARRKELLKAYKGSANANDYPGIRCTIFHRHCD